MGRLRACFGRLGDPMQGLRKANTTLLHNLRRQARPFFYCREAATTTLRPAGPVKPKNPPAQRAGQT